MYRPFRIYSEANWSRIAFKLPPYEEVKRAKNPGKIAKMYMKAADKIYEKDKWADRDDITIYCYIKGLMFLLWDSKRIYIHPTKWGRPREKADWQKFAQKLWHEIYDDYI